MRNWRAAAAGHGADRDARGLSGGHDRYPACRCSPERLASGAIFRALAADLLEFRGRELVLRRGAALQRVAQLDEIDRRHDAATTLGALAAYLLQLDGGELVLRRRSPLH